MATARFFAEEGARLYLIDLPGSPLEESARDLPQSCEIALRHLSVTDEAEVKGAVDDMVGRYGGVDAVVNSAGVVVVELALEGSIETFRRVVDINLTGTWIVSQAAARHMAANGGGAIDLRAQPVGRQMADLRRNRGPGRGLARL